MTLCTACSNDDSSGGAGSGASSGGAPSGGYSGMSSGGASGASQAGAKSGGASGSGTSGASGASSSGGSAGSAGAGSGGSTSSGGAQATGGGATDAGPDVGGDAGADPCATALFCEDFESYPTGKAPTGHWKTSINMGSVSVVDTAHFGGSKSVQCSTQASSSTKTAYIRLDAAPVFPAPGNAYFGRMMTRLEAAPETSVHWTFVQSSGLIAGQNYHSVYRYGGQLPQTSGTMFLGTKLMANYDTPDNYSGTGPASDCWNHASAQVMPVAKWTCVEWQFDGPNDTLRFWLNGAPVDSLTVQGKGQGCVHQDKTFEWKAPNFDNLELGWESYQMDSARTLYVDDVVISTKRIGCPSPLP